MTSGNRSFSTRVAIILVLTVLALSTRLLPLSFSPYPFNNDGVTEAKIAGDILVSGHLTYPDDAFYVTSHSVITPVYDVMLAFYASAIGATTYGVAQIAVAFFSILTVVGVYLVSWRITRSLEGALAAALFVALFGTCVFLTGSAWKESLGVSMLVLLAYCYMHRQKNAILLLEAVILVTLPFVHHLAAAIGYLAIGYLTCWSVVFAIRNRSLKKRHVVDVVILATLALMAYVYYDLSSLDRLSIVSSSLNLTLMMLVVLGLTVVMILALMKRDHVRCSFAPVPAIIVGGLFVLDYFNPIFPYAQGFATYTLLLGVVSGVLLSFAWYGFEVLVESKSTYRAIPLGLLLPAVTFVCFAVLTGFGLDSHKMFYRTIDFADISLALGVGIAISHVRDRARLRNWLVAVMMVALLLSFPFAYMTNTLVGLRHDTQQYEVDALRWADSVAGTSYSVSSDERLAYSARALFDMGKDPSLPSVLASGNVPDRSSLNLMLEEWTTLGVNDYPRGHPVLDQQWMSSVLAASDVMYVGGPESDQLIIFQSAYGCTF